MFAGMHGHGMRGGGCGPRGGWRGGPFLVSWEVRGGGGMGRGRGMGGRGGRSPRMFDGGELRLVLLKLIADEPRHGYDLIREIEAMTGGAYAPSPGVVYPTLTLLDEMGFVAEQHAEGAKKRFAATEEGRAHLAENREQVDALFERLSHMGERARRGDRAPLRRAMGNLRHVVQDRLMAGELGDEAVYEVAALIDEVVRKIERMK